MEGLEKLGSHEALLFPRAIREEWDKELLARIDLAKQTLKEIE